MGIEIQSLPRKLPRYMLGPMQNRERRMLLLLHRGLTQIALLAVSDPQRVFELADTLEPMPLECAHPDAEARWLDRLESYLRRYPEGAEWLREPLKLRQGDVDVMLYGPQAATS